MQVRVKPHLTYANVMSTLAVFLLLGGGVAWAQERIGSNQIENRAVTAPKLAVGAVSPRAIKRGAVRPLHIGRGSVRPAHIARGAVSPAHIRDGAVHGSKLAQESVSAAKLANGSVSGAKLANGSVSGAKLAGGLTVPGPPIGSAGGDLTGAYPNPGLADESVGLDQIRSDLVVARGYAAVNHLGGVSSARSKNVTSDNVTVTNGHHCFHDLGFEHSNVPIAIGNDSIELKATAIVPGPAACPPNTDFSIQIRNADGDLTSRAFSVVIF